MFSIKPLNFTFYGKSLLLHKQKITMNITQRFSEMKLYWSQTKKYGFNVVIINYMYHVSKRNNPIFTFSVYFSLILHWNSVTLIFLNYTRLDHGVWAQVHVVQRFEYIFNVCTEITWIFQTYITNLIYTYERKSFNHICSLIRKSVSWQNF